MQTFYQEFNTLNYVIRESQNILLVAHSSPDGDTVGSCLAFKEYLKTLNKNVSVICFDPFPAFLSFLFNESFKLPSEININHYELVIACDSVERGFKQINNSIKENQVITLLDHHPDIKIAGDINIIDAGYSSVCEIAYDYFSFNKIEITREMAKCMMLGILSDTGIFQHSNTTPRMLGIASDLMKKGAPIAKIVKAAFSSKNICTLRLWGRAFEKAKINSETGMIVSVLTKSDIEECQATTEDIAQVSSILNTVPGTKFALILSERDDGIIKGSLRSEEYKGIDVSRIAARFGGGGHKLASGFEVSGKIVETQGGWEII
jgi:bifunctional oligoribonuclease and PAP phosphatase NrnA